MGWGRRGAGGTALPCPTVPSLGAGCWQGPMAGSTGSLGPARHLGEGMHSWAAVSAISESLPDITGASGARAVRGSQPPEC